MQAVSEALGPHTCNGLKCTSAEKALDPSSKYPGFCLKAFPCCGPGTSELPLGSARILCIQMHIHTHKYTHTHTHLHACTRYRTPTTHTVTPTCILSHPYILLYTCLLSHKSSHVHTLTCTYTQPQTPTSRPELCRIAYPDPQEFSSPPAPLSRLWKITSRSSRSKSLPS